MTIVDNLTPTQYKPLRLIIEIRPDATLTADSLTLKSVFDILNAAGAQVGRDHPTPQATAAQKTAFLNWVNSNLATYEAAVGLARHTEA